MLAEHFHHSAIGGKKLIVGSGRGVPLTARRFEESFKTIEESFVGTEDSKISLLCSRSAIPAICLTCWT